MGETSKIEISPEEVRKILERAIQRKSKPKPKMKDGELPIVPPDIQIANEIRIHEQKLKEAEKKNPNTP